jgi:ABC-type branched-subunit amino acid transport system substrate-binding protein
MALMTVCLSGCFGKAEPQPIIVGHVSTLSCPGSAAGEHAVRGIRLALEELDRDLSKGPARPVVVRHTDAHGDMEAFASEAVRLVAINHAVALLGGNTAAEVEKLAKGEVPVIAPAGLRARAMGDLVVLSGLAPAFQGQALARYVAQEFSAGAAAVLVDEWHVVCLQVIRPQSPMTMRLVFG